MRIAVGRADLVRLIATLPPEEAICAAAMLGFEKQEEPAIPRIEADPVTPAAVSQTVLHQEPIPFVRTEGMTFTDGPEPTEPIAPAAGLDEDDLTSPGRSVFATPQSPPLAPWSRLWPALQSALRASTPGRAPDVPAIVRALGRGEILRRVPRLTRVAWAGRASVWIDRSDRLVPFWSDQADVCDRLRKACGRTGLDVRVVDTRWLASAISGRRDRLAGFRPDPGVPVIVLGDLGVHGSPTERAAWAGAARRLKHARVRMTALVPSTSARWDPSVARSWGAVAWERGRRSAAPSVRTEPCSREARADRLLRLISPAALVQPGLLRALRRLLPAGEADASTEADVWSHPDVRVADATGLVLHAEAAVRLRQRFADEEDPGIKRLVSQTIRHWHEGLPKELLRMETLAWHALIPAEIAATPGDRADALAFAARIEGALRRDDTGPRLSAALRRFGRTMLGSMPASAYERIPGLKVVWAAAFEGVAGAQVPPGIELLAIHAALGRRSGEPAWWAVRQVGDRLVFSVAPGGAMWPSRDAGPGSPVALMLAAQRYLLIQRGGDAFERQIVLEEGLSIPLHPGERLVLRTDRCAVVLGSWEREAWAVAAGRDRFGSWADAEIKGVVQRFRWLPPGRFLMGSPAREAGRWADDEGPVHRVTWTRGRWMADTPVTQALWEAVMGRNPSKFKSPERPVEQVSYDDCQGFLAELNKLLPGLEARLPGEAEWEYACRAGTQTATWVGDLRKNVARDMAMLDLIAWHGSNSRGNTQQVRGKAPNPFGLYDMLGNVWEWCMDAWSDYPPNDVVEPRAVELAGSMRVRRGGSWFFLARYVRAADRNGLDPSVRLSDLGFRLARDDQSSERAEPRTQSVPPGAKKAKQ